MKTLKLMHHAGTLECMGIRRTQMKKGPQLVADLIISTKTDAKNLAFLSAGLFSRKGVPRLGCEDEISFAGDLEHHEFAVAFTPKDETRYHDISVWRIAAILLPQKRVNLCFAVSLKLTGKKIGELAERIAMPLQFSLEPMLHLFDKKGVRRSKVEADKAAKKKAAKGGGKK